MSSRKRKLRSGRRGKWVDEEKPDKNGEAVCGVRVHLFILLCGLRCVLLHHARCAFNDRQLYFRDKGHSNLREIPCAMVRALREAGTNMGGRRCFSACLGRWQGTCISASMLAPRAPVCTCACPCTSPCTCEADVELISLCYSRAHVQCSMLIGQQTVQTIVKV